MKFFRSFYIFAFLVFVLALTVACNYFTISTGDTEAKHFNTIIVLGYPANPDGTPTPEQRERVLEGVREYKTGIAPILIMTGGAAHNAYTEAHAMAQFAVSQGVPSSNILEEGQARNTIQNIFYSAQIMHQHGWFSAEVVSSPSHLPRASLILQTFDHRQPSLSIAWKTHAARWPPEYSLGRKAALFTAEAWSCLKLRVMDFPSSRFLPTP